MKRSFILALTILMALALSACQIEILPASAMHRDEGKTYDMELYEYEPLEDIPLSEINTGEIMCDDTPLKEKDVIGKTKENELFVMQYSPQLLSTIGSYGSRGAARVYRTTHFVDGVYEYTDNSCLAWYFFDDKESYEESLAAYLDTEIRDYFLRENNSASYFYALYQPVSWLDINQDGIYQYEEAILDMDTWRGDYILID